jgi:predicted nucleotidyltransferase
MDDLARLQQEIRFALVASHCRAAAYFGSIAHGTADELSDADLIVCCDHAAAIRFRAALHKALDVVLYRPFDGREPAGRYWFRVLSPYAKLDVSFHLPDEYIALLAEGGPFIDPPFLEIDVTESDQRLDPGPAVVPNTLDEIVFSQLLYKYTVGTKNALRGTHSKENIEDLDRLLGLAARGQVSDSVAWLYLDAKSRYSNRQRP